MYGTYSDVSPSGEEGLYHLYNQELGLCQHASYIKTRVIKEIHIQKIDHFSVSNLMEFWLRYMRFKTIKWSGVASWRIEYYALF